MLIIAHRSGPVNYPEQTIHSAKDALALGADIVEIDVRLTADNVLAITHDQNLQRVFGADKNVSDLTAEEFLALRHVKDPAFCAHLFEDFLKSGVAPLLIHIKPSDPEVMIPELLRVINAYDYADKVILGVPAVEYVTKIRSIDPSVKILSFGDRNAVSDFIEARVDYIRLWENWLDPVVVRQIRESSTKLWVMSGSAGETVGEPTEAGLQMILRYEPDGILINDVRRLANR